MADCFVMPILNATNMFDEGKEAIAIAEIERLLRKDAGTPELSGNGKIIDGDRRY